MYYRFNRPGLSSSSRATRRGFTLVELMVAMALTMFIMVILSQAFATGVDVFSQLKAIGDMEENLRAASTTLRSDLAADHFEGKRRLSDPDFYINRPRQGFFRIAIAAPGAILEGNDANNPPLPSYRSTSCVMHLAVKRRGNQRQDFFSASVPPLNPGPSPLLAGSTNFFNQPIDALLQDNANTYNSQWAEVAYFLVQTGVTPNGTPLYALYRVERVVVPDNSYLNWANGVAGTPLTVNGTSTIVVNGTPTQIPNVKAYAQLSWQDSGTGNMYFNSPHDLAVMTKDATGNLVPTSRSFFFTTSGNLAVPAGFTLDTTTAAGQANVLTPGGRGAALVIGNVVSFQVRVLQSSIPTTANPARTYGSDFADVSFDSASPAGNTSLISAVAVTIRVWDQKSQQARQITVMQDM
jgi:prepilin-type N-terminal cleavage/methylation domain-containing protein